MALLELRKVRRDFTLEQQSIRAVAELDLDVDRGEFVSVVGHSGSGKTTLLSMMGGILSPSGGKVIFNGTDIYSLDDDGLSRYRADSVGYVFQFASLMPVLTAKENLLLPTIFGSAPDKGNSGVLEKRAIEHLALVGLSDKAGAYPGQLSGGQQRRVAIARALMNDPLLLLADEPTGDLDEGTEAEVMDLFRRVNREKGVAIVMVTHNMELARVASRSIRMTLGAVELL